MQYSKVIKLSANKQFYCELVSDAILNDDDVLAKIYMIFANDCDIKLKDCLISEIGDQHD